MLQVYLQRIAAIVVFSLLSLPMLFATTIVVSSIADSGAGSLRAAVDNANSGDTIRFNSSILKQTIMLSSEIMINKPLRIQGNGIGNTIISGGGNNRIFNVNVDGNVYIGILEIINGASGESGGAVLNTIGQLQLDGVRISNSSAAGTGVGNGGGAVASAGRLLVTASQFMDNSAMGDASSGGAILSTGGGIAVTGTIFTGNSATRAGGAIEISGAETGNLLSSVTMTGNSAGSAPGNGGGLHITGPANMIVRGGTYNNNTAAREGGALWNGAGVMVVRGATIDGNTASGDAADDGGGGIFNNGGTLRIFAGTSITNNAADGMSGSGGGVFNSVGGNLRIIRANISGNTANRAGGGIEDISGAGTVFSMSLATINDNEVFNSPGNGGGIHIGGDGSLGVFGGTISGNKAGAEGGGIWNNMGNTTVFGTMISDNEAAGDEANQGGGGLYNNEGGGSILVKGGTVITGNRATGASGSGGGILNDEGGTLEILNAVVTKNTANRAGGGIEDASGNTTLVVISEATVDSNEVFTSPGNGGGIHVGGNGGLSFRSGMVRGNTAGAEGGGIWIASGTLTVGQGVVFDGNEALGDDADQGGGALYNNGNGTIIVKNNVIFNNNRATGASGSGGAILNNTGATLLIDRATFTGNTANRAGGAIEDASGDDGGFDGFQVRSSTFTNNEVFTSPGNGGAIHLSGRGDLLIVGGTFTGNTAGSEGGAVWNNLGTTKIIGGTYTDNVASGAGGDNGGGAIFNNGGTMNVFGITATGNQATGDSGSGGAMLTSGNMTVIGCSFSNNTANRAGGAVELINGLYSSTNNTYDNNTVGSAPGNGGAFHVTGMSSRVIINGGSVTNNTAGNEGGGIWNQAGTNMSVNGVAIMNNSVVGTTEGDAGGGIFNNGGVIEVSNSTIAGNTVAAESTIGGGIFNKSGGDFTLTNSTVSGNTTGGAGGGIANDGMFDIVNSTIAFNTALVGGGYLQVTESANLDITGTIISDNDATGDFFEDFSSGPNSVTSGGFNLIGNDDQDNFEEIGSDIIGGDANLAPLADNFGPTMTHALTCPSDAVDAGNPADNSNDQIGQAPVGTRDIGAYELPDGCVGGRDVAGENLTLDAPNLLDENVSLFPNPTGEGAVNVVIPTVIEGEVTMRLIDGSGRLRLERRTSAAGTFRFPLQDLPNGTYSMQIINGNQVTTRRLIKMK